MAKDDEASARYACLELRFCIEYITYDQLQTYIEEVADDALLKWTPRQIINELREIDPSTDKSRAIAIGIEETPGVEAKEMHFLGEDRRFSLQWAHSHHNALGNFLHAPTLDQIRKDRIAAKEVMLNKAHKVIKEIEQILASPVYHVSFGQIYEFDCSCGRKIKRRIESINNERGIVCPNSECKAIHDIVSTSEDGNITIERRTTKCPCPSCKVTNYVGSHLVCQDTIMTCGHCGAKSQFVYALRPVNTVSNETTM